MRSLTPTGCSIYGSDTAAEESKLSKVAVDPETGVIYATSEKQNEGVEVEILKFETVEDGTTSAESIGSFTSPVLGPFPLPDNAGQVVSARYFSSDRSLVLLLYGGDIATVQLEGSDGGVGPVEVVGSIDSGIKAAAWSPDEEHLIMVTGEDMVVCMTRQFDTLHEEPLRTEDFGEDKFINVGWGSKSTQFHGSLGKAAAKSQPVAGQHRAHPSDDGLPIITFRGDASYFAISSLDYYPQSSDARRQIRIYSREASNGFVPKLSATSENLSGLEGAIDWRPSGNLISGLVRYGYDGGASGREGRWEVAMLERNGLRHGGFELREDLGVWKDGKVLGLRWNSDSEILATWVRRQEEDVVQLWTMKNYHYYLKQELHPQSSSKRFTDVIWHSEQPMTLYLTEDDCVQSRSFVWDTYTARLPMPNDTASVAVVDGKSLLVTPFRTQNTPPPMSSYTLTLPSVPVHVSMSSYTDSLAVLYGGGHVQIWDLFTKVPDKKGSKLRGGGKVAEPKLRSETTLSLDGTAGRSLAIGPEGQVVVLSSDPGRTLVTIAGVEEKDETSEVEPTAERVLFSSNGKAIVVHSNGTYAILNEPESVAQLCQNAQTILVSQESELLFALSSNGKLVFAPLGLEDNLDAAPLASAVTSFTLTPEFLIYTTTSQVSHYAPLDVLRRMARGEDVTSGEKEWDTRRVERGALVVAACPSSMSLVLQMPRGNLETVYPRPMVLAVIRRQVLDGQYRSAFVHCRKHRLDLNMLYDLNPTQFMSSLPEFVKQILEVDYLNLFVTSLEEKDCAAEMFKDLRKPSSASTSATSSKVNSICDALRQLLESQDLVKYIETILTTHVCKQPPDYESGLRLLLQLQADHAEIVEDAVKYIIFLSDVNKLYDVALGMYNFQLVLMVAQYSQKDPKEYLPFLRELRALDQHEQRFRIDDHLGRRESALRNLVAAGDERFDDATSYLSRYELYDEAFRLYADKKESLPVLHDLYGDYLYDRRDFYEAAISYSMASHPAKAMKAYEKAHAWRELFTIAKVRELDDQAIAAMVERVTDHLSGRGKSLEASQVFMEYAEDVDSAVDTLTRGAEFAEAFRIASRYGRSDLVESIIHPGLDDATENLTEIFEEMQGQLDKEMKRIAELRVIREEDPDTFYIVDTEPALEGVDVATNATTVATAFTRYTVAPTTAFSQSTKITGQTNKSKHKASRKRATGRKGTVDEYDYLVASIGRLVTRVDEKSADALALFRQLILASPEHRQLASDLQATVTNLRLALSVSIEEAWRDRDLILEGVVASGGMGLGGDPSKSLEAVMPIMTEWKGLGVLARQ